jgi:uncharacterized membrane protein
VPDDLARVAVGLPVATLWSLTVPQLSKHRFLTAIAAAISAAYVLAPELPSPRSLLLLVLATAVAAGLSHSTSQREEEEEEEEETSSRSIWQFGVVLMLAAIAAAAMDFDQARSAVEHAIDSNQAALVITGLFACVFLGGSFVAWVLSPFTLDGDKKNEPRATLENAGRYIGWFERAVLFAFVMGGAPEAAAIALAAKSFARFPTFREHQEGFAEYFLIGSLASIAVAVAVAAATRGALGIGPF